MLDRVFEEELNLYKLLTSQNAYNEAATNLVQAQYAKKNPNEIELLTAECQSAKEKYEKFAKPFGSSALINTVLQTNNTPTNSVKPLDTFSVEESKAINENNKNLAEKTLLSEMSNLTMEAQDEPEMKIRHLI